MLLLQCSLWRSVISVATWLVLKYIVCIFAQRSVLLPQWTICRQVHSRHPTSFKRPPPNIHRYVTKKRRFLADYKRRMDWAERLLQDEEERKQKALENAGKETEPHMLHVVYLMKPLIGRPWWEKKIADQLHIEKVWWILSLRNILWHISAVTDPGIGGRGYDASTLFPLCHFPDLLCCEVASLSPARESGGVL